MKKFFYTLLLVTGLSLSVNAQTIDGAKTNDQTAKFTSVVDEPELNKGIITIAKDATEVVALTETSYWKVRNSWGTAWQKIDIFLPDGTLFREMTEVANGTNIPTVGWTEGIYTATLTDETGSYTETFTVN